MVSRDSEKDQSVSGFRTRSIAPRWGAGGEDFDAADTEDAEEGKMEEERKRERKRKGPAYVNDTGRASPRRSFSEPRYQADAWLLRPKNASSSALMRSFNVVHMPCGAPGSTLRTAPFTIFADCKPAATMGTI